MTTEKDIMQITPRVEALAALCRQHDKIDAQLYKEYDVKRGLRDLNGEGVLVTITNVSNLYYWDLIDIANELFNAGAEAVAINSVRLTIHTQITERRKVEQIEDEATGEITGQRESIIHVVGGEELQPPYRIRAIGDAATLETALNMPGGVLEPLTTIYGANVTVQRMANLTIPAAVIPAYHYATVPETTTE